MFHTKKEQLNYLYFAHFLESYNEANKNKFDSSIHQIKKVITDDDIGMRNGFKLVFHQA